MGDEDGLDAIGQCEEMSWQGGGNHCHRFRAKEILYQ